MSLDLPDKGVLPRSFLFNGPTTFRRQLTWRNRVGEGNLVGQGLRSRDVLKRERMDEEAQRRAYLVRCLPQAQNGWP